MNFTTLDGIRTHYLVRGSGPHLLMMAPRGFDASIASWQSGRWQDMENGAIEALSKHFTVVAYDRRESGLSGGRVERLSWASYARQAKLLLDHLGVEKTWLIGVCMGVGVANQFASLYPGACFGQFLVHPVGGFRWRRRMHAFFDRHIAYVRQRGLEAVRQRAQKTSFMSDPEAGPWGSAIGIDDAFARDFVTQDVERYLDIVAATRDGLFPDTFASGPSPRELLDIEVPSSIWPGDDGSHSMSSAHQIRELMPRVAFWNKHPSEQNASNMLEQILRVTRLASAGELPFDPAILSPSMPQFKE